MKKLIAIMLLLAMMSAFFVACGSNTQSNSDSSDTTADDTTAADDTTSGETTSYLLPNRDLDGYSFKWLDHVQRAGIVVDEGEAVDESSIAYQARVERDAEIMDRFNVTFEDVRSNTDVSQYVLKDALNPEASYDVGEISGPDNCSALITNDTVYDASEVPHLNLDQDWYQQQANEEYNILGKQFFVAGAFPSFPSTPNFFFNKDMVIDLKLELPYDTIVEGNWTIEELMKYTSVGYKDTNEATPGIDKGDTFGYAGHPNSVAYFYQGMGGKTTSRDDEGAVVPVFSNDTVDAIYSKLINFYLDPNNYTTDGDTIAAHQVFYDGRAMFCYWVTSKLEYTEIDSFERGLCILPKYDIDQENYHCPSSGGLKVFPANSRDIEVTGYIYEGLCEATLRIVYPAQIQEAVDFEQLTDAGSIEVQKVIDKSLLYDILKNCDPSQGNLASCGFILQCFQNSTTPAAFAPSVKPVYDKIFEDFFDQVKKY